MWTRYRTRTLLLCFLALCLLPACGRKNDPYQVVGRGATATGALDLMDDLDVSRLSPMLQAVVREANQEGLEGQAYQQYIVQRLSEEIQSISAIDLNEDGAADPILVKPEGEAENYVIYSVRVPDPARSIPSSPTDSQWLEIAENGIEVASIKAVLQRQQERIAYETTPNPHLYENHRNNHYHSHDSFVESYFKIMLIRSLFMPSFGWWGPGYFGWYGGFYRPMPVSTVRTTRTRTINRYPASQASSTAVRGRSGNPVSSSYSRTHQNNPPSSIRAMKDRRVAAARASARSTRAGGFGRGSTAGRSSTGRSSAGRSGGFGGGFGGRGK